MVKVECSWCGRVRPGTEAGELPASHGICPQCLEPLLVGLGVDGEELDELVERARKHWARP